MKNTILIPTNGFEGTWPSIEYGAWVAQAIHANVVLLGIAEDRQPVPDARQAAVEGILDRAAALLGAKGVPCSIERHYGRCEDVLRQAALDLDGLTVVGPLGRPRLRRLLVGRSIRGVLESISTPVLYVQTACLPLKKLLICVGGLGFDITAEHLALRLGAAAGAEVTLLHVAPPVDLDYPTARLEREHWRDLENTDSLLGRNLRAGLEAARKAGMTASLKARQGDVVEEILAEVNSGAYDLVSMGSQHGITGLRHLYEPNITDEVAEHVPCPLLTARYSTAPASA